MSEARPKLSRWLRRHSLTLVAALGGAAGVAYAAGWHKSETTTPSQVVTTVKIQEQAPRDTQQDTVQIALVLDTSSSMNGLINQARSQLWNMVDQMGKLTRDVNGKTRGVKIQLALYEYGNDTLDPNTGYIRQVQAFTDDLDMVSEKLHGLFTNGGSEFAGQAIQVASTELQWSSDPSALKFVFVAGNEEFDQGPITATDAMQAAAKKDINVQLIYCGIKHPTWEAAAKIAKSDLMTIDQNRVAAHIPSPQDDEILRLGGELNSTYMAYGAGGASSFARQSKADMSSAKMSPKVALERAQLKSKKAYDNTSWDLVDAMDKNSNVLAETSDDKLPAELRGKSLDEKRALVAANTAKRAALKSKIAQLEVERTKFLTAEQAKHTGVPEQSLQTELMKTTKKVATKKGYKL
ncbi:MAG: VWA domain-containing protein [Deltaproteobacteria bacterium]|nr:VWA domain-containing protein [Deltaproteobacteria bacterium]